MKSHEIVPGSNAGDRRTITETAMAAMPIVVVQSQRGKWAVRSWEVLYGRTYAHSRSLVWINRSALPFVHGV